ncbi:peptidase M20 [bacterium CG_4_10_14_0_2_um_filter_33_32]|nr:MAG: hypothetical protein AUJ93_04555 [bacterium CG2_30_33_46]PIR68005.1 MAG: peptidase M20 [bacterium CG10_big_fil_rev_8_21_14_0_10_33_18]PIU76984.1 MAG: peptidase M20 [bacterium CG06_land_8_20_14_3_00_33_50]PIW81448.1 MAG: peptidase M20 [bacterium CG_4_8_14_3_um_filter_33_28]PIY85365.1 MAG: peptidase M20 [bacterium CG_4_10_14_0_8_um_filter_33_57]PIZ86610.1 MAG: peptidase M20 [bacterium CG_4_10_14_0_2_um_filter_33_32]PJA72688.1 MAG: peptidase M20 [bacterium CG_4_9_14_3_um_filter_33_26]
MKINQKRLVDNFIKLVKIDSESGEEKEIISHLKKELQSLGFKTYIDKIGNLIASNSNKPIVALIAHVDTVKPGKGIKPIITKSGVIKTDGSTILGSDNKAGIVAILEILKSFKDHKQKISLEIVFTVSEEVGLLGSSSLDFKKIRSKRAINLDSKPGDICVSEPSVMHFDIEIKGRAAHAGMEPEKGINSILVASEAIAKLKWGRIDKETTINIGIINGGMARNIIPQSVILQAEVRSRNPKQFKKYSSEIIAEFNKAVKKYSAKCKIISRQVSSAFIIKSSDYLVQLLINSCRSSKLKYRVIPIDGFTDASHFNRYGIKTVTAGAAGDNIHTTDESLRIKDLVNGTKIIHDTILELAKEG